MTFQIYDLVYGTYAEIENFRRQTTQSQETNNLIFAGVAELADAPDLGSGVNRCAGSSPVTRTSMSVHNGFKL